MSCIIHDDNSASMKVVPSVTVEHEDEAQESISSMANSMENSVVTRRQSASILNDVNELVKRRSQLMTDLNMKSPSYETGSSESDETKVPPTHGENNKSMVDADSGSVVKNTDSLRISSRVETVRLVFENYYDSMNKYQTQIKLFADGRPIYPGVEGIFNPLQIMRNRRIRRKQGISLRKGSLTKVKLPSQHFSKHRKPHLIWQINPYEYSGDIEWRKDHMHELRNHRNHLWFPHKETLTITTIPPRTKESFASQARYEQYYKAHLKQTSRSASNNFYIKPNLIQQDGNPHRKDPDFKSTPRKGSSNSENISSNLGSPSSINEVGTVTRMEEVQNIQKMAYNLQLSNLKVNNTRSGLDEIVTEDSKKFQDKLVTFRKYQKMNQSQSEELKIQVDDISKSIHKLGAFNNEKSIKIEELLGYCDRTNGEINTSITLKIRDLYERIDKLTTGHTTTLTDVFYNLIEKIIVSILWCIWVLVGILRIIRGIICFFWRVLKWLFL